MASSVVKTFNCMDALARAPQGLTVSEVATVAGLSRPAATRLLQRLSADGMTVRDAKTLRYRLGLKLHEWATLAIQSGTPLNIARHEFVRLSQDMGRDCNFIVMEGIDAVALERCETVNGITLNRPLAGRRVWFETATGKAIVAYSAPATAKTIMQQTLKHEDVADAKAFAVEMTAELNEIRSRGFAMATGVRPEGFVSIGMPIISNTGYAVAGIGTYLASTELDTDGGMSVVTQIKAACARISHYLGYESEVTPLVS
jgi:DNA-binding IclR family transcriptional regulator